MLPLILQETVCSTLDELVGREVHFKSWRPVGGGCISNGGMFSTSEGPYFLKFNTTNFFSAEADSLDLLAKTGTIAVPEVISTGTVEDHHYILLEWITSNVQQANHWEHLGTNVAALHQVTGPFYGLKEDNFIGALPQVNTPSDNWTEFFIQNRLEPMLQSAEKKRYITPEIRKQFEKMYLALPDLFPKEPPALLHGDLWTGNVLTGSNGEAVLIDPCVYYGHREAEIAFSYLFGGFSDEFYHAYNTVHPLAEGFEERKDIYNLYPLLVHLNLFGESYLFTIQSAIKRF
ncbi:MAG: fructosamine kinase family protein [Bacteroidota bacterium]|nr:fructosamine kinase family protein [Bacteroidota bacterium]